MLVKLDQWTMEKIDWVLVGESFPWVIFSIIGLLLCVLVLKVWVEVHNPMRLLTREEKWAIKEGKGHAVLNEGEYYFHFEWNDEGE